MQSHVYIIHGWGGSPEGNWFPWLRKQLEARGFGVEIPAMPDPDHPKLDVWLSELQKTVREPDERVFFVGHSLGVITILRYLESLAPGQKIGGAILVAGFSESISISELEDFFPKPLDYEKVKSTAKRFVAIHSDNDPYVPLRQGERMRDRLGAEHIIVHGAGHLNAGNGYFELPIVREKIIEMNEILCPIFIEKWNSL